MYKDEMENDLGKIWKRWLVAEFNMLRLETVIDEDWFTKYDADYNIETFLMAFEDHMTKKQITFANHLLQVMVEIQNHDNIQESWNSKMRVSNG